MSLRRQARLKLQNKTPLKVLRGVPDGAEVVVVGDDEGVENAKVHLINGVERDELSEHHLQAALSSSNLYHSTPTALPSSPSFRQAAAQPATQPLPAYQIPTPDAGGIVADYDTLYAKTSWVDPFSYVKFSEKVEEISYGWGGLAYDMDDKDEAWLKEFNAKEEGTSADASQTAAAAHVRGSTRQKGKDKEKEAVGPLRISEEEFEYVMGMFEMWSEKNVPMLHTDLSLLPAFTAFEPIFIETPPASFYPSYEVPHNLPAPRTLVRMARNIFTHWKSKKEIRKGKPIIPQLNVGRLKEQRTKTALDAESGGGPEQFDETNDGDPYLCFRRRDVKVARKTRQKDLQSVDRMKSVQGELKTACGIVALLLDREKDKQRQAAAEKDLWEAKHELMMFKRQHPQLAFTQEEENLLNRQLQTQQMAPPMSVSLMGQGASKRQRMDRDHREDSQRLQGSMGQPTPRISKSRPQSPARDLPPPEQLAGMFARKVEEEMKKKKDADRLWEDSTDLAFHPMPNPVPMRYFRPLPSSELSVQKTSYRSERDISSPETETPFARRTNHPPAFRLRRGRGGIMRLDRRIPVSTRFRGRSDSDEVSGGRKALSERDEDGDVTMDDDDRTSSEEEEEEEEEEEDLERERLLADRWAYDADQGRVGFGMDGVEGDQVIIDDYEVRYIKLRSSLITPMDMELLTPTRAALVRVNQLMLIPPERPPHVTFNRPMPQAAQMQYQQQQQQAAIMQQRQVMEAQQRMLNATQGQGQFEVKPAYPMNGMPSPAMGHPQMGAQQLQQPQQLRRMASNGNGQAIGPRPPQSPARLMQGQQQMPQQAQQLVHAQAQAQQAQQEVVRQMTAQRLQAQMQQQVQVQGQIQPTQSMPPPMRVPSGGQQIGPLQVQGDVNGMPNNVRRISGNGMQPVQGTPMMQHMQIPNGGGQMQMQVDMGNGNGNINGVVQTQIQQSPRQPLAQSVPPLPNGVQLPNGAYDMSAQIFANAGNTGVLNAQAQAHMKAQILQQQQQAAQAKMAGMNGVVQGSPVNGQNGMMNLPITQMNLKLPASRAQMAAQQGQLRASGSPAHSAASASPHIVQQQPVMQAVGGSGHQGDF